MRCTTSVSTVRSISIAFVVLLFVFNAVYYLTVSNDPNAQINSGGFLQPNTAPSALDAGISLLCAHLRVGETSHGYKSAIFRDRSYQTCSSGTREAIDSENFEVSFYLLEPPCNRTVNLLCGRISGRDRTLVLSVSGSHIVEASDTGVLYTASAIVVSMDRCTHQNSGWSDIRNIYGNFEGILSCAEQLSREHPQGVLVWTGYDDLIPLLGGVVEHAELLQHLALHHLIQRFGVVVPGVPGQQHSWLRIGAGVEPNAADAFAKVRTVQQHFQRLGVENNPALRFEKIASFQNQRFRAYQRGELAALCAPLLLTRKYEARCHPPGSLRFPLLVTGLGGAGTHYVARQLGAEGWHVRHEEIGGEDGSVSWLYAANDHMIGAKYPYGELPPSKSSVLYPRFAHVVHLVREPMAQISSFTAHSNKSYDFVLQTLREYLPLRDAAAAVPIVAQLEKAREVQQQCFRGESCHLHFAALAWVYWNRFVHSYADATFRVDQTKELLQHVCSLAASPTAPLRVRNRYCAVSGCPAVNTAPQSTPGFLGSLKGSVFKLVDDVAGVCKINDALYQRAAAHKRHLQYTLQDVQRLDSRLVEMIRQDAKLYGLTVAERDPAM